MSYPILKIQNQIGSARLMVVSKNQPVEKIIECIKNGAKLFGENRVQELRRKWESLELQEYRNQVELHFIGHLQTNKVKDVCPLVDAIQSVDPMTVSATQSWR